MRRTPLPVRRDRRGIAAVEFAVAIPMVMLMMLGLSDVVQLGRAHLRAQSAAMQIGQIVSQCERFTASDETVLKELTARILGSFAEDNAQWQLRINAFGRDSENKDFNWLVMQSGGAERAGAPMTVKSKGTELPTGDPVPPSTARVPYEMGRNKLLFRTEVFAVVDRTALSRALSLFQAGTWKLTLGFETASGEAVHSTRVPNTDSLKAKGTAGAMGCLT